MEKSNKFIIGAGLSAMIYAFYNKEYVIIGDKLGGQVSNGSVGPMYLHKTPATEKLLSDLKITADVVDINIGFLKDGKISKDIDIVSKKEYYVKSRNLPEDYDLSSIPDTILNQGKTKFQAYLVDWKDIVRKLRERINLIEGTVLKVATSSKTIKFQTFGEDIELFYEELVSTIPLFSLMNITDVHLDSSVLENTTCDICYAVSDDGDFDECNFDYLYVTDPNLDYYRITLNRDLRVVYEFPRQYKLEEVQKAYPELKIKEVINIPFGKIIKNLDFKEFQGIKLLGRYAQINQRIKTEVICEVAQK